MSTSTVNISFDEDFLRQIDEVAAQESRSRSELIREAARSYISRKQKWDAIFSATAKAVSSSGLKPEDIQKEIASYRRQNRSGR